MKYLEKSFTLPANSRPMTDEEWEAIWGPKPLVVTITSYRDMDIPDEFIYPARNIHELAADYTPPATESETRCADTVANGEYVRVKTDGDYPFLGSVDKTGNLTAAHCPNCHCRPDSYRHIETCVSPSEAD